MKWSGLRLGVAAATTRGFKEAEFERLGRVIASLLGSDGQAGDGGVTGAKQVVSQLCKEFPIYEGGGA